jgi:hypothetical protein
MAADGHPLAGLGGKGRAQAAVASSDAVFWWRARHLFLDPIAALSPGGHGGEGRKIGALDICRSGAPSKVGASGTGAVLRRRVLPLVVLPAFYLCGVATTPLLREVSIIGFLMQHCRPSDEVNGCQAAPPTLHASWPTQFISPPGCVAAEEDLPLQLVVISISSQILLVMCTPPIF